MKTKIKMSTIAKIPFFITITVIILFISTGNAHSQKGSVKCPTKLPLDLKLIEKKPQKYLVSSMLKLGDLKGNVLEQNQISGEYTRGLNNNSVCWNNVRISSSKGNQEPVSINKTVDCMENLTYVSPTMNVLKQNFFEKCTSADNINFLRVLPGITVRFESIAWTNYDSLKLNQPMVLKTENNNIFNIENFGSINLKQLSITWTGISQINNKSCVVLQFQSGYNPFNSKENNININGSVFFSGTIWVSLEDKQIEYATMSEASAIEAIIPGSQNQTMTLQNEIVMKRL